MDPWISTVERKMQARIVSATLNRKKSMFLTKREASLLERSLEYCFSIIEATEGSIRIPLIAIRTLLYIFTEPHSSVALRRSVGHLSISLVVMLCCFHRNIHTACHQE